MPSALCQEVAIQRIVPLLEKHRRAAIARPGGASIDRLSAINGLFVCLTTFNRAGVMSEMIWQFARTFGSASAILRPSAGSVGNEIG
jgi:hypothetical protein